MSFAADLKDFASNFRDTYKTLHESGRDELARENAAYLRRDQAAKDRAEAEGRAAGRGTLGAGEHDYTAVPPAEGYNTRGKRPTFTTVNFDNTAPRLINDLVTEVGLPEHAAQGFVGRLGAETGGFSTLQETNPTVPGSRGGFGYAQWTGDRRKAFESYARANNLDPASYEANKGFLVHELKNTGEGRVLAALRRTRDAQEAGSVVERQFLRPGIPHGRRGISWVDRAGKFGLGRRAALDLEDDGTVPVVYAARGGVIPSGLDRALDTTQSESAGSNPVTRDVMDAERDDLDDGYDPRSLVDIDGARRAVAGGLKFGQRLLGLETHHAAVPEAAKVNPDGVTALQTNAGAPPREQIETIHKVVDPRGELPPHLREIASFNAQEKFWRARGEPQRADAAAWGMLQASKKAVSQYGALALSIDDPVKRAQVIAKAHNEHLPDGEVMKITGKSGDGAKFELFDNKGQLTEKGVLAMDDMVKMATGMHNGTAYLQAMVNFSTAAPSAAERKTEAERKAIEDYERARNPEDDRDFMNTQTDEEREKFLKMPLSAQKVYRKEHMARVEQDRKQSNFDTRLQVGAENMDRKEATDLAKTAIRIGQWETTRDQIMTMHEQKLAQLKVQEEGRNNRFDASQLARRQRQIELDILGRRTKGKDGAGVKMTAKQKDAADVDARELSTAQAITSRSDVPEETDPEGGPWTGPALAEERLAGVPAQRSFAAARERQAKLEGKSGVDPEATATEITRLWTAPKAEGGFEQKTPLTPKQRDTFTGLASGFAEANSLPAEQAVRIAVDAANPQVPVRFKPDPTDPRGATVQLGAHPPLRIGADTLNLIAMARGGRLNPAQAVPDRTYRGTDYRTNPPPQARTALPGVTGNPTNAAAGGWVQRGLEEGARGAKARRRALELDMLESGQLNPMYRP